MKLSTSVEDVRFIGSTYAKRLGKLDIYTVEDLIHHYPFRYDDLSTISKIFSLQPGETVTLQCTITSIKNDFSKNRKQLQRAIVEDSTGSIDVVWFNQPFLTNTLKRGVEVNLSGKVSQFGYKRSLQAPEYELVAQKRMHSFGPIHTGRIVPVYPETYGISSKWLRSRIAYILDQIRDDLEEYLPNELKIKYGLMGYTDAIRQIHFPENNHILQRSRQRLAFDELFLIQLSSQIRKRSWQKETIGKKLSIINCKLKIKEFIDNLPFILTDAQQRCVDEILKDLAKKQPMNRLLQGDVGSGKTVVAAIAAYITHLNKYKTVVMAPTEILARQHYVSLTELFKPYGVDIELVTSYTRKRKSNSTSSTASIFVGTQALLFKKPIKDIALVIIDEQHRFGVAQRTKLREMGLHPHLLSMTATPIPRSVALIVHSELDLSYIDELPKGRKRVKTWLVPNKKRESAYKWIHSQIRGLNSKVQNQAFIICPLIDESEHETMKSIRSAKTEYEKLKNIIFPDLRLGLLHGKIKSKEKQTILDNFDKGKFDILVATPVVEVGIDITGATIMMIEAAERFGLAQLHQLRGRVGRSDKQSYCLLFTESEREATRKRLKNLETVYTGAKLAEIDLSTRGPGQIYGTAQHGFSSFKIARFTDHELIKKAKEGTDWIFSIEPSFDETTKSHYSGLQKAIQPYIIQSVNPD